MIQNYQAQIKVTILPRLYAVSVTLQRPTFDKMVSLLQGATSRGQPASGEITAMQPHCLAGRAQRRLTYAVIFVEQSGLLIVKLYTMGKVCMRLLVPITSFVPWQIILGKATCYSFFNCMIGVPCSWAWMLTGSLCSFVGFQRTDKTGVLGALMVQIFIFSGTCTVWLRGHMHLSQWVPIYRPQHLPGAGSGVESS